MQRSSHKLGAETHTTTTTTTTTATTATTKTTPLSLSLSLLGPLVRIAERLGVAQENLLAVAKGRLAGRASDAASVVGLVVVELDVVANNVAVAAVAHNAVVCVVIALAIVLAIALVE